MTSLPAGRSKALLSIAPLVTSMISLCVGTSFAKGLFPLAGPAGMTALRNGLAAILLIVVLRAWRWRVARTDWGAIVRYGAILGVMNLVFYCAIQRLPFGVALAIEFLGPLGVAVWHSARRLDFLWIGCAASGVLVLVVPRSFGQALDGVGVALALAAAVCWALYIVWGKQLGGRLPELQAVCLGLCVAATITVPIGIAVEGRALLQPHVLASGAAVALLSAALPYALEMFSLKRLPPQVFGVAVSLEPAIGAIAAFLVLHEQLSALQDVGICFVMAASIGMTLSRPALQLAAPL